ncbi:flagellar basal-body MS-ring/collar protein FliF [Aurantivibrio plasticivorans]
MAEAVDDLDGGGSIGGSTRSSNDLIEGFNNLNLLRQAGLMVGLAVSVAIGFAVVMWTQEEEFRPLYGSLERLDSAEVVQIFDTNDIRYKVDPNTGTLLVDAKDINKARLKLAEAGITGDKSVGFELLDKEQPLGSSQFMENARYRRSLEGELARTITSIRSVRQARVHLAIPKTSVFVRDTREPRASVFIELFPGRSLSSQQVQGIANLVASSINELKLENVTVVDQKGQLFTAETEDPEFSMAQKQRDYTRKLEKDYTTRVNSILSPVVGGDKYRAEVSAEVDFTEVEQAAETYNPDLPAMRSEQTLEESRASGGAAAGIPGALTNQPPGAAQAPEQAGGQATENTGAVSGNTRSQATRNYELDRTVSYTKHQVGRLKRLSVAVVIDDKVSVNPETQEEVREPWSQAELERLEVLVRDAVGFSAARGDSVNIINTPFLADRSFEFGEVEPLEIWEQPWFKTTLKQAAGVLIIIALLFGLLRPVLKSLAASGLHAKEMDEASEMAALEAAGLDSFDTLSDETVTLSGGGSLSLPNPDQGYEQRLNMVKGLIAEDPGRVAQVVKRWAAVDE